MGCTLEGCGVLFTMLTPSVPTALLLLLVTLTAATIWFGTSASCAERLAMIYGLRITVIATRPAAAPAMPADPPRDAARRRNSARFVALRTCPVR